MRVLALDMTMAMGRLGEASRWRPVSLSMTGLGGNVYTLRYKSDLVTERQNTFPILGKHMTTCTFKLMTCLSAQFHALILPPCHY